MTRLSVRRKRLRRICRWQQFRIQDALSNIIRRVAEPAMRDLMTFGSGETDIGLLAGAARILFTGVHGTRYGR